MPTIHAVNLSRRQGVSSVPGGPTRRLVHGMGGRDKRGHDDLIY